MLRHHAQAPALALACLAGLAGALAGCAEGPLTEDDVAEARTRYVVELMNFVVVEEDPATLPLADPAADDAAPDDAAAVGDVEGEDDDAAAGADDAVPEPPPAPATRDVILDLLVRRTGGDGLPGITVDVEQVDAREQPKATFRVWIDTSQLGGKGATTQVTQRLEDVEVATDDKFAAEIREDVPADMRGEYREFAEATSPQ